MVMQCGHEGDEHLGTFKRVGGELKNEKVVQASAGINFSVFLCENGKVYTVGSGEKGVLGNGRVRRRCRGREGGCVRLTKDTFTDLADWRTHRQGQGALHRTSRTLPRPWRVGEQEDCANHQRTATHRRSRRRGLLLRMGFRRCVTCYSQVVLSDLFTHSDAVLHSM